MTKGPHQSQSQSPQKIRTNHHQTSERTTQTQRKALGPPHSPLQNFAHSKKHTQHPPVPHSQPQPQSSISFQITFPSPQHYHPTPWTHQPSFVSSSPPLLCLPPPHPHLRAHQHHQ